MSYDLVNTVVPAKTVLLTRDNEAGLGVFVLKRHHKIDFAYGALVFPGGKLDQQDSDSVMLELCAEQNHGNDNLNSRIVVSAKHMRKRVSYWLVM